jgi:hypothetical protein
MSPIILIVLSLIVVVSSQATNPYCTYNCYGVGDAPSCQSYCYNQGNAPICSSYCYNTGSSPLCKSVCQTSFAPLCTSYCINTGSSVCTAHCGESTKKDLNECTSYCGTPGGNAPLCTSYCATCDDNSCVVTNGDGTISMSGCTTCQAGGTAPLCANNCHAYIPPATASPGSSSDSNSKLATTIVCSVVGALLSGAIGMYFWKLQKKKEIDRLWEKNVLCKKVKDKLNLDVPDPETGSGFDLQKGMEFLVEEFKKTQGYGHNVDKMTSEELDELMIYLIPSFISHQVVASGWLGSKKTIDIKQLKKEINGIIHTVQLSYCKGNVV